MTAWVDLYWLPLGAGGHFVRFNGLAYERVSAWRGHRPARDLYHAGLMVGLDDQTYAVEMGPVWNVADGDRGVLREGPVGSAWLGRFRAFRYEVRCWSGGRIPDIAEAVASPVRTTEDPARAAAVLEILKEVPALVWGRGELGTGMWNSDSLVAWALAQTGRVMDAIPAPAGGQPRVERWAGVGLAPGSVVMADSRR